MSLTTPTEGRSVSRWSDGARLPLTPDWSGTFGIEFRSRRPRCWMRGHTRDWIIAYVGDRSIHWKASNRSCLATGGAAGRLQNADLRFGLKASTGAASIFVENVWDERADLFMNNRWAKQRRSVNRPRTIGVQFRYDF